MPVPVTGLVVCNRARAVLNDNSSLLWDDVTLMKFVDIAYAEIQTILKRSRCPIMRKMSTAQTVTSGTVSFGAAITDLVEPIKLWEAAQSAARSTGSEMTEQAIIPLVSQTTTLKFWAWNGITIDLVGSSTTRDVFVWYWRMIDSPATSASSLVIPEIELYIVPRVIALALQSIGVKDVVGVWNETAMTAVGAIVSANKGQKMEAKA